MQTNFARELSGLVESLNLGLVHVVTWSSRVTLTLIAIAERPDLFRSAIHYEPVENDAFEADESITELQSVWFSRWQALGQVLSADDTERAGELLMENVVELPPGGYHQKREQFQEVVRQNIRTLPLDEALSPDDLLISCKRLACISVPTHIVGGADTHEYWRRLSRRFHGIRAGVVQRFSNIKLALQSLLAGGSGP